MEVIAGRGTVMCGRSAAFVQGPESDRAGFVAGQFKVAMRLHLFFTALVVPDGYLLTSH